MDLAADIASARAKLPSPLPPLTLVDIGGGLPVNFADESHTPSFHEYALELRSKVLENVSINLILKSVQLACGLFADS